MKILLLIRHHYRYIIYKNLYKTYKYILYNINQNNISMLDDRNAKSIQNNKRIPKYKIGDDNIVKNTNEKQRNYLNIAAKIAIKSPGNPHKHGAIIVYKDTIISSGYNHYIKGNSMHAEVSAISKINKKYKGILNECDIYVVRIGPNSFNNPLKYSRPCLDCESLIIRYNLKNVYYSTSYEYDNIRGNITNKNNCCKCFL